MAYGVPFVVTNVTYYTTYGNKWQDLDFFRQGESLILSKKRTVFPVWVTVWVKTQFVSNVQASIFHISVRPILFFLVDLTINS